MYIQNKTKKLITLYTLENTDRLQQNKEMEQILKIGQETATITDS